MSNLTSNIISHQVFLQRLSTQTASLSIPFINDMRKEVKESILKFGDDERTTKKLNKLMASLDGVLGDVTSDWKKTVEKSLRDISDYENKWFNYTLKAAVSDEAKVNSVSNAEVWSAIKFAPVAATNSPTGMIDMLEGWGENEKNRLVRGVQTGFIQGQTTREIVKQVVGIGGLADISERNADTVIRTAIAHVSNTARVEGYKANDGIIEGYQFVATLDSRTSTTCRGFDGQSFNIGKGPLPPLHYKCRSTTTPKVSSEFDFLDEGAKRAARGADGGMQVDASTSYYDFLKSQPAAFQDAALGVTRGKIFRNAGMTPEEFRAASVDGFGNPMTLKEMAEMDKRVAHYLGNISYDTN